MECSKHVSDKGLITGVNDCEVQTVSPAVCVHSLWTFSRISACVPRLEDDILDAPSYPCHRQFFMSKFHCGRVSSIELAIASPVILCRFWNPKNSS